MGIEPSSVPPGERFVAWSLRAIAVAVAAELARAGRVARCGAPGPPSGSRGIGGVDNRDEEYRIRFPLPSIDPFLCAVAKSKRPRRTNRRRVELRFKRAFRWSGYGQQIVDGDLAGCTPLLNTKAP
jgi:hypothetical protein